jgi:hypothetical protein
MMELSSTRTFLAGASFTAASNCQAARNWKHIRKNRVREHWHSPGVAHREVRNTDTYNEHDDKLDSGQQIIYVSQIGSVETWAE